VDPINEAFSPLIGLPSWQVVNGHGSWIMMEFGQPHLEFGQPRLMPVRLEDAPPKARQRSAVVHGQWRLYIYLCDWALSVEGVQLVHCNSHRSRIARALSVLNGQALADVDVQRHDGSTNFSFDLGGLLSTRPAPAGTYDDELVEQWLLYQPGGRVLCVRADGMYYSGEGEPDDDDDAAYLPLPSQ
jgi:hypothetical protein